MNFPLISISMLYVYCALAAFLALIGFILFMYFITLSREKKDMVIIIDNADRWALHYEKLKDMDKLKLGDEVYFLGDKNAKLSAKGRALYIFSKGKPAPLHISYNKAEWLDSKSLMSAINNELIKMMVKPAESFKDQLMLFGALGGILAGIASVLILLKQFGVIK